MKGSQIISHEVHFPNMISITFNSPGTVLVHCVSGISRSATIVLAYLMIKKNQTIRDAIETIR